MIVLLPNTLDPEKYEPSIFSPKVEEEVTNLTHLLAENEKVARRYLLQFMTREKMQQIQIFLLNEHTTLTILQEYLSQIVEGGRWGIISDAGLPCIADPGAHLLFLSRQKGIKVRALAGPSSIYLALISSGLPAQQFAFHGYLPKDENELKKNLVHLEKRAYKENATQIWIETPYRSAKMGKICLETLQNSTLFCMARNITMTSENIQSYPIQKWKKMGIDMGKELCVFLLSCSYAKK